MPQIGIDTSEDAMPIELGDPLIAKCNFWQILKSTKFSEALESTKIWPESYPIGRQPHQV